MAKNKKLFVWFFGILAGLSLCLGTAFFLPTTAAKAEKKTLDCDGVTVSFGERNNIKDDNFAGVIKGATGATKMLYVHALEVGGTIQVAFAEAFKAADYESLEVNVYINEWDAADGGSDKLAAYSSGDTEFANMAGDVVGPYGGKLVKLVADTSKLADKDGNVAGFVIKNISSGTDTANLYFDSIVLIPKSNVSAITQEDVAALTERATDVHEYEMSGINWVDASSGTLNVYNPMWIGNNSAGHAVPAVGQTAGDTNRMLISSASTDVTGVFKFQMSVYDYVEYGSGSDSFCFTVGSYILYNSGTRGWIIIKLVDEGEGKRAKQEFIATLSTEPLLKKTDKSVTDWSKMEKNTIVFGVEWDETTATTTISIAVNDKGWKVADDTQPYNGLFMPGIDDTASIFIYNSDAKDSNMIYLSSTYDPETYVPDYVKDEAFTGVKDISEIVPMGANGLKVATEGAKNNKDKVVFLREDIEDYNAKMKVTVDDPAKFKMYVTMLQGETKDADLHANNGGVWMYLDNTVANMLGGGIGVTAKKLDAAGITLEANKTFEVEYGMVRCNENGMFSGYEAYLKVNGTVLVKAYYAIGTLKDRGTYSGIFLNDQADSPCNVTIQAVELSKESPVKVELTPVRKISKKDEYTRFNVKVSGVFGNQKVSGLEIVEGNGSAVIEKNVDDQGNVKFEYLKILKEDGSTVKVKVTVTNEFGSFDSNIVEFKLAGASTGGEEAKGGCSGVIGTSVASLGLVLTVAAGVFLKKKKQ